MEVKKLDTGERDFSEKCDGLSASAMAARPDNDFVSKGLLIFPKLPTMIKSNDELSKVDAFLNE